MRSALFYTVPSIVTTERGMRRGHLVFVLPVLAGPVLAQVSFPNCTVVGYEWSYNSLKQNPCDVAATLVSTCYGGTFSFAPLPFSWKYSGPPSGQSNLCQCNTVVYSLISACGGCQGSSWISWPQWSYNCSSTAPPSTFPFAIPDGTRVPHWSYLDVTLTGDWNATAAQSAGDSPEAKPSPTTTSSAAGASSSSNQNKSHTGLIAGAAAGAVVGVSLLIGIIFWYLWRWRSRGEGQQPTSPANEAFVNAQKISFPVSPSHTETLTTPSPGPLTHTEAQPAGPFRQLGPDDSIISMSTDRYYDPSDPNTFPRLVVPPSMSGIQTTHNRGNVDNNESPNSTDRPPYMYGLPLV